MQNWLDQTSGEARQRQLVKRVHEIRYDHWLNKHSGDTISRIMDNASQAQSGINGSVIRALLNIANVIATLVYMCVLNGRLAVVTFVSVVGASAFLVLAGPVMRRLWNQRWAQEGKVSSFIQDDVQGIEVVKSLLLYRWIITRFDALCRPILQTIRRIQLWDRTVDLAGEMFMLIGLLVVLGYASLLAARGEVTVGTITAFGVVYERLSWPIQALMRIWPNLQQSLAAAERTYELIDEPLAPEVVGDRLPDFSRTDLLPFLRIERIEFDHVCFSYPGSTRPVLDNLTFTIDGGKFTAIVGPTGAGKSTIIRLLLRLLDPDSGVIRVFFSFSTPSSKTNGSGILGGMPIQNEICMELQSMPVFAWRSLIGYVPQEPGLFNVSLADNIRMGKLGVSSPTTVQGGTDQVLSHDSEQLDAAVRLALLEDVVRRLPDGIHTRIGERGSVLSGGERQRVAIARAAYRNPYLLLLDEATSSLDNLNERLVQRALVDLSTGRTTVAIAHRLSTVMGADRILVIDEGRIIEQGSHEQLVAAGGKYASLLAAGQLLSNASHGMETTEGV